MAADPLGGGLDAEAAQRGLRGDARHCVFVTVWARVVASVACHQRGERDGAAGRHGSGRR